MRGACRALTLRTTTVDVRLLDLIRIKSACFHRISHRNGAVPECRGVDGTQWLRDESTSKSAPMCNPVTLTSTDEPA